MPAFAVGPVVFRRLSRSFDDAGTALRLRYTVNVEKMTSLRSLARRRVIHDAE
jgi:hypothetical protein